MHTVDAEWAGIFSSAEADPTISFRVALSWDCNPCSSTLWTEYRESEIEALSYARFYRRLKSPPQKSCHRLGAATSVPSYHHSAGLKPPVPSGFGLHIAMAMFR